VSDVEPFFESPAFELLDFESPVFASLDVVSRAGESEVESESPDEVAFFDPPRLSVL
jgi:hypothetical protein